MYEVGSLVHFILFHLKTQFSQNILLNRLSFQGMLAKFKDILVLLLKSGTLTLIQNYYPIYTPYFSYDIYFNNVFEKKAYD